MAPVAVTPDELDMFARLLDRQDDQLEALTALCDTRCRDVGGLHRDGDLGASVDALGRRQADLLARCRQALAEAARQTTDAARAYRAGDAGVAAALHRIVPGGPAPVAPRGPEAAPGPSARDRPRILGEPGPDVDRLIQRIESARQRVGEHEELWFRVTGDSLGAQVVAPLAGRVTRLAALAAAYETLAGGTYQVAWSIRAGAGRVVPGWRTAAGREFATFANRCHHGLGGLGDLDRVIAAGLRCAYADAAALATGTLDMADELLCDVLGPLRRLVYPDTTLRIWLVPAQTKEMYALIRRGLDILGDVADRRRALDERYDLLRRAVGRWHETLASAGSGGPADGVGPPAHRYGDFEADAGWDPASGAERLALLPLRGGTDGQR